MRKLYTLMLMAAVTSSQAQTITSVTFSPQPVDACDIVDITISGTYPAPNYMSTNFAFSITGNVMAIDLFASGSGGGPVTPYSQTLPPSGPYTPGAYTVVTRLFLNNDTIVPVSTFNSNLNVGPQPVVDPGISTFPAAMCNVGPGIPLISLLDGSPDPGGQWKDPFGLPHGPTLVPSDDPPGLYEYVFDYAPTVPCTDTGSFVFISYLPNNNPGINTNYSICTIDPPLDLFTVLNGNPQTGGSWTGPGGSTFSGIYDPAINQSGLYRYTVVGLPPCGDPSAAVNVTELSPANAGTGSSVLVCETDTAFDLFSALTGAPNNGTWYDPLGFLYGFADSTYFNAVFDFPGAYAYVVTNAACDPDTAFVNVTVDPLPCGIGVSENDPNVLRFALMPNPTEGILTVELSTVTPDGTARIDLLDMRGMVVNSTYPGNDFRTVMDLSGLAKGMYMVRLVSATGQTVQRVVLR